MNDTRERGIRRWVAPLALFALVWSGCSSPPPVSPEQLAAEEARLMQPYNEEVAVVADRIDFELSANFDADLARPATSREWHDMQRTEVDGDVLLRWVSRGGVQEPLRFQIGGVEFAALQGATLRVRGSGKTLALDAVAKGHVIMRGGQTRAECEELRFSNGQMRSR